MSVSALVLLALVGQADPKGAVPPSVDPAGSCKTCHADVVSARSSGKDVHADLACGDCHPGRGFNPHVAPELHEDTARAAADWATIAKRSPAAFTQCEMCHHAEVQEFQQSVHALAANDEHNPLKPTCASCHGDIHDVTEASQTKKAVADRCIACHGFAEEGKVPTSPFVVDTYRDTIHGKMVQLGNDRAAACADCHTGHRVQPHADPRSTVHASNRVETCGQCHEDADESFVAAISHEPPRIDRNFWSWIVALGFSVLTVGTIVFLFLHVILDFFKMSRGAFTPAKAHHAKETAAVSADAQVERFDIHARIQHWGMMASFTTLVLTGWPLKMAHVDASHALVKLFGGQAMAALIHRAAGVVLLAVAIYHLVFIIIRAKQGRLSLAMVPGLKDATDLLGNIAYFLGLKKERPRFGRWTYYEKFDYWAVFWGMAIMGGSGLILWFPTIASKLIPGSLISISHLAHSDEALLAALAIFLWHFYNVHLKPTIFPMSWVWLTGKLSVEALYEEHREEYERQFGTKPPAPPVSEPTWHAKHVWSIVGVALVLIAGAGVVVGNVRSVRDEIAALSAGHHGGAIGAGHGTVVAATVDPKLASAYQPGFDAFTRCFDCHNKERFEQGGAGFPHLMHFDDQGVDRDCKQCHEADWHRSMETKTTLCLDCHEATDIGVSAKK